MTVRDPVIALSDEDRIITITEGEATPGQPPELAARGRKKRLFPGIMAVTIATAAVVVGTVHRPNSAPDAGSVATPAAAPPAPAPALALTPLPAAPAGTSVPVLTDAYDEESVVGISEAAREALEQARGHFRLAVELYNERDLNAAMVELKRANSLAPRRQILYDMGQIAYQQQDYVTALRNLRRYLTDGGDAIPASRRFEVETMTGRLEQRIGRLVVQAPPRTRILIDGNEVGVVPLGAAIWANVGRRHLQAISPAGDRWDSVLDLAGGDAVTVMVGPLRPRKLAVRPDDAPISEDDPMPPGSANASGRGW